jgi:hypothetical protein
MVIMASSSSNDVAPVLTALIGAAHIAELKRAARFGPLVACTRVQTKTAEPLVETIVVQHQQAAVGLETLDSAESLHIIEGEALLTLRSETTASVFEVHLGPAGSGKPFYYRVPAATSRRIDSLSEWLVYHKATELKPQRLSSEARHLDDE